MLTPDLVNLHLQESRVAELAEAEIADLADIDGPGIVGGDMVHFLWEMFEATDLLLATVLILYARSLHPPAEVEMVREVRNMALKGIEDEIALVESEVVAMKDGIQRLLRNPVDMLLPGAIGPLLGAIVKGLGTAKK